MGQKTVSKTKKWYILGMKDGLKISNRETPSRLLISGKCTKNTVKILKTGGIQHHPVFKR